MEKSAWWICYSRNHKIRNTAIIWSLLLLLCYSHVLLHIFRWLYATLYNNSIVFTNGIERSSSSSSSGSNHIFFCWLLSFALSSFLSPSECVWVSVCQSAFSILNGEKKKKKKKKNQSVLEVATATHYTTEKSEQDFVKRIKEKSVKNRIEKKAQPRATFTFALCGWY